MKPQLIVLAYLVLTTLMGTVLVKRSKNVNELFLAKNGLGVLLLVPLVMSETLGGAATIGSSAAAFQMGATAMWSCVGLGLGCIAFMLAFTRFYHVLHATRGVMSIPNAYLLIFDKRTKFVMLMLVCVVYTILFALQPVATAAVLAPMFDVSPTVIIFLSGAIYIAVAVVGGLRGLASMNVVHAMVLFFGLGGLAFLAVRLFGGAENIIVQTPPQYFDILQPSGFVVASWVVGAILAQLSSAIMVNVTLGANSIQSARRGILGGSIVVLIFAAFPVILGITAKAAMPGIPPNTVLYSLAETMGPIMSGITSMAIIAAIFSSAPALLLVVSGTLTQDLYKGILKPKATPHEVLFFAKASTIGVGIVAVILGSMTDSIFQATLGAFQIRSIAGLVLLLALAWPRVTADAGFWSILSGGGLAALWHFTGNPFGVQPLFPSLALGLGVLVCITLRSKERYSPGYKAYQQMIKEYDERMRDEPRPDEAPATAQLSQSLQS